MEYQKSTDPRIVNWTKAEKLFLLDGLIKYGSRNVSVFSHSITGKNEEEIKAAIQFYKDTTDLPSKPKKKRESSLERSLNRWAKIVGRFYAAHPDCKEMATAVYLIAMFEPMSPPAANNGIDLKKIYLMMGKMIEGKPIQFDSNDIPSMRYLNNCIEEIYNKTKQWQVEMKNGEK